LTKETGSSESEEEDEQDVVPQLKSLKEVIHALEEVSFFLDYKGYTDEAYETNKLVNSVSQLHSLKSARLPSMSTLTEVKHAHDNLSY